MNGSEKRVVYIDSCAFNVLFDEEVKIMTEFPDVDFRLKTTKGVVKELEDISVDKPIKNFALELINSGKIHVDSFFGFSDGQNQYRHIGGFGEGNFIRGTQNHFLKKTENTLGSVKKKSGVRNNETDRDLLAHGLGQIILTAETVLGCSELKQLAESRGTWIINIAKWKETIQSKQITLRRYVENCLVYSLPMLCMVVYISNTTNTLQIK